ncbi:MAG: MFS transporter, partial [Chloroflexota bacterium]
MSKCKIYMAAQQDDTKMAKAHIQAEQQINFKHNLRVNTSSLSLFWFGASFFAIRTICPLFLSYLTDNTLVFSILSVITSTGWLLPQLFTASWVQRQPVKKFIPVNVGFFSERLPIMLLPLAAWIVLRSESFAVVLFLLLLTWHTVGAGVVAVGWQDMLAKIFPVEWRGRFFGITNFIGNGTGILGASAAAWILNKIKYPFNFMLTFGIAGLFIFLSWIFLSLTREPASVPEENPPDRKSYWRNLPNFIRDDKNYRQYLISQALSSIGVMTLGFLTLYVLRKWGVGASMVSLFTTSMFGGSALSSLVFGWIGDKIGHKLVIEISNVLIGLAILIALLAPSPAWFYLVFALQGGASAGFILSGISIIFELCDENIRPTYIGLTNTVIGIFSGISPLFGGWIIDSLGFNWLFW